MEDGFVMEVIKGGPMKHICKLLILAFFLFPSLGFAEVKEIIAEGTYNMGDGETPTVAEYAFDSGWGRRMGDPDRAKACFYFLLVFVFLSF